MTLEGRYYHGLGRRKTAIAQVRIYPGEGPLVVNGQPIDVFLPIAYDRYHALEPLGVLEDVNIGMSVLVKGGGHNGQAGAIRLGLARALCEMNPDHRSPLKRAGMMRRDPRAKERKKPGLKRARKAKQYTKR